MENIMDGGNQGFHVGSWLQFQDSAGEDISYATKQQYDRRLTVCDACYQGNAQCSYNEGATVCTQCLLQGTICTYGLKRAKTESMTSSHSQRARALEAEVLRMEEKLRSIGIDPGECAPDECRVEDEDNDDDESDLEDDDLDSNNFFSSQYSSVSPEGRKSFDSCTSPLSSCSFSVESPSQAVVLQTGQERNGIFFGSSSSFHILSHEGIRFIRGKSGVDDFPDKLLSQPCWKSINISPWPSDIYADLFKCQVYKALPPRSEVFALLRIYFTSINHIFPIIHEETFMKMVEWQYTQQTCTDVGRWASINALLALSYKYRDDRSPRSEKDIAKSWLYWKNAAAVYPQLALRPNNIIGIQALLAMAIFARVNGHIQLAIPLVTAAMKSSQALGLHRRNSSHEITPIEQETRRRVWWCVFVMDQSIGIKTGRGYLLRPDDFDIDLPGEYPQKDSDNELHWSISLFRSNCAHAVLVSNIYRELYATKAFYKSFTEACKTVDNLTIQLREWKREHSRLSYKLPEKVNKYQEVEYVTYIVERLSYLNSIILINRMPVQFETAARRSAYPDRDASENISATSRHHSLICLHAAKDTLRALDTFPWRDVGFSWVLLDYIFYAASILFAHIIDKPLAAEHGAVEENMALLKLATNYFSTLASFHDRPKSAKFLAIMTSILERTAGNVTDKALKRANTIAMNTAKEVPFPLPLEQQYYVPGVEQTPDIRFSNFNPPSSLPFSDGILPENPGLMGPPAAQMFAQNTAFPYVVPMPDQGIQMMDTYSNMYSGFYQNDIPSYMAAPGPDVFWGQGVAPGILGPIPNEGKHGPSDPNNTMLDYMWNGYG